MDEKDETQNKSVETAEWVNPPVEIPLPQCWAFSPSQSRCTLNAGHFGKHAVAIEWSDEECMTPGRITIPTTIPYIGGGGGGGAASKIAYNTISMAAEAPEVQMPPLPPDELDDGLDMHDGTICIACDHPSNRHTMDGCAVTNCQCVAFVG